MGNGADSEREDERYETIGRTAACLTYILFTIKFLVIATLIPLVILHFTGKPLWIAPLIGVGAFILYLIGWRIIWVFLEWCSKQ